MESYSLSDEQLNIIETITKNKKNTLIIGKAGVGKSVTLRAIKKYFDDDAKTGFILAPTGVAAINVEGMTIHKFMGSLWQIKRQFTRDFCPDYIIIDEVSMVRADLLDDLDQRLRSEFGNMFEPFAGIQIILIGDPGQLPPVLIPDSAEAVYINENYKTPYFFSSAAYAKIVWEIKQLTKVFRQKEDEKAYVKLLNLVRNGERDKVIKALNTICITDKPKGIILCARIS